MSSLRKYRLAVVASHPVQYQAPLFQKLARHPQIDLTAYYESDFSLRGERDPGFGVPVKWDRPLLEGYRSKFLKNGTDMSSGGRSLGSLAIIPEFWRERYDAVFIHSYATLLSLMAYVGAWSSRTPVLLHTESELIRLRHPLMQAIKRVFLGVLFRGTAGFQAIGSHNRAFYRYYGVPESRIYHTPYSVDNEFFTSEGAKWMAQREQLKVGLGFAPNVPVILFSGKLIPRKRPMDLLHAYAGLVEQRVAAGLLFIGEGELRPVLEQFAREQGLTQVKITGFQNQTQLPRYYAAGDVFVLPSEFDPWGLVVNEAMLFSIPVIVSDRVGAGPDLVKDNETGYTYPVGDVMRLRALLKQLVLNTDLRQRMGEAAQERIKHWNYDTCVTEIVRAVAEVAR
jgi:glycosyltransferase involved in cell wall biosynthesis